MTSPHVALEALRGGELDAAISNAVVGLVRDYVGRGPTKARTIHKGNLVLCVLEDTMTRAEQSLVAAGDDEFVARMRHALQNAMRDELTTAVEGFTHRRVVAFLSANHLEPDLAAELFVLDKPFTETTDDSVPAEESTYARSA
jgi:uncharacterized protein YbcI